MKKVFWSKAKNTLTVVVLVVMVFIVSYGLSKVFLTDLNINGTVIRSLVHLF